MNKREPVLLDGAALFKLSAHSPAHSSAHSSAHNPAHSPAHREQASPEHRRQTLQRTDSKELLQPDFVHEAEAPPTLATAQREREDSAPVSREL